MAVPGEVYSVKTITRFTPAVFNPSNGLNITHWRVVANAGAGANNLVIASGFSNLFAANYKPLMSNQSQFQGVIVQRVLPLPILLPFGSTTGAAFGDVVGDAMAPQTCGMITKREFGVGRAKRGRVYVPWPCEVDNTVEGVPGALYMGRLNTLAGILSAGTLFGIPPDQTTFEPVLFHPSPPPGTATFIASAVARLYWGTQRRRQNAYKSDTPIIIPPA